MLRVSSKSRSTSIVARDGWTEPTSPLRASKANQPRTLVLDEEERNSSRIQEGPGLLASESE